MKRLCVLNLAGVSLRVLGRDGQLWVNRLPSPPGPMRPLLPALPAPMQACLTTGVGPNRHGVIADGLYRRGRGEISFVERSNTLLSKKRFWHSRRLAARPTVSLVFWSQPLAGAADLVVGAMTPWPQDGPPAEQPLGLYDELAQRIGEFDNDWLWGPGASCEAAIWIAQAACELWRSRRPDLQWVTLPGLDVELVRHALGSPQAMEAMARIDQAARQVARCVCDDGGEVIVLSDGPFVNVERAARPNLRLREAGLLKSIEEDGRERLDLGHTRAFAMVQHQVAHLYCVDESATIAAREAVEGDPAVAAVLPRQEVFPDGSGHYRSGEYILLAEPNAYMDCRWLSPQESGAGWADAVEIQCCGYDPADLLDHRPSGPRPAPAVRASRGLVYSDPLDQCVLAGTCELPAPAEPTVLDVGEIVRKIMGI